MNGYRGADEGPEVAVKIYSRPERKEKSVNFFVACN